MEALHFDYTLTEEEYLAQEDTALTRHEFVSGYLRAMAGESTDHNEIALTLASELRRRMRGGPCKTFINGIKFRPLPKAPSLYYYPDVMVACDPRDTDKRYRCYPRLVIEVTSESTESIDRSEKMLAYLQNETLEEYFIVAQDRPEITCFRRAKGWEREVVSGFDATLELTSVDTTLPLTVIYEGVLRPPQS
jgi:Uma2 family endonuclease